MWPCARITTGARLPPNMAASSVGAPNHSGGQPPHSTYNMKILRAFGRRTAFARRVLTRVGAWVKPRYTRGIESALARVEERSAWQGGEIERLRAEIVQVRTEYARVRDENRALLNSILGIAGIPPIPVAVRDAPALETPNTNSAAPPRSDPSAQSGPEAPASITAADKDHPQVPTAVSGPVSPSQYDNSANPEAHSDSAARSGSQLPEALMRNEKRAQAAANTRGEKLQNVASPMRRRSWQQINRTLELEAARKKSGHDTEPLDA